MIKFENRSNGRYYYLAVQRDMLNEYVLIIMRGGRAANIVRRMGFSSALVLQDRIDQLSKRRLQRGYSLIHS